MLNLFSKLLLAGSVVTLTACGGGDYQDLDDFMADKKSRPAGMIKPIPVFKAYKAFTYSASALRSPFEKPVEVTEITRLRMASNVKPDPNRTKEYLEQFSLDSLTMVGTLQQGDVLWALMQDEEGGVHRTRLGNFMGRNHGRIVESTETYVSVIEIVPNGVDGWVERPRTIKLKTIEE
ncbi:pilus assembly protein PilP [Oceanicoccus sagamiensis]|uniref:Pilus assembly protein PilP n=2 Tax=Oceanicoccus sagamiensis TaxID=716816 RepID=A0A1X9NGZ2_9GAMM|nr:pilus assembly protein PilP [Oceanicoccus sagamiensis]ARN74207.1 pilus assembly protein PilP [Oceanicoccus sagamiensis]